MDCGRSELSFDDMMKDPPSVDAWRLNTLQDYVIPPRSMAKVIVSNPRINLNTDVIVEGSRLLLLDKEIAVPATILTFQDGKAELWMTNAQSEARFIPKGMCVGHATTLDESRLNCMSNVQTR